MRKFLAAGRLTREGKLAEATMAIQRALTSGARAGAHITAPWGVGTRAGRTPSPTALDGLVRESARAERRPDGGPAVVDEVSTPGRFLDSSFTGAAGTRTFKLFSPSGFEGEMLPLVVMLHGCTQDPDDFAAGTRMNELAQDEGAFVLYPAQAARSNSHRCWNWFSPADQRRGAGEPALLAGMVRHVLQTHPIDPDRVYVAGLSAGGAMAAILASEYPDVFAAAGIHSGIPTGAAHDVASAFSVMKSGPAATPSWPGAATRWPLPPGAAPTVAPRAGTKRPASAPVIVFHGDADATVTAANGDAVIAAALGGAADAVAESVDESPAVGTRRVRRTVWRGAHASADAPTLAEQWLVSGAPHAWSGGAPAGSYTDPQGPDASREMLRFFLAHPRRRA
ncbi:MAG TPA: PHB depolymerase family esterase [Caldimonas sp.]|nr:PHB depolymerase family esterase [Caldimonas sp.]HEV7577850.1 PHB depolymerase family esterase [Caldimonas sp.]